MNKTDLAAKVFEKMDKGDGSCSKQTVSDVIDNVISAITDTIKTGEPVSLKGFGTFDMVHSAERTARNPKTGASVSVPAKNKARFRPAGTFHDKMNEK